MSPLPMMVCCCSSARGWSDCLARKKLHQTCTCMDIIIKEVILDYGPIHEFWCYSFERFNGMLGNQPTNKQFLIDNASHTYDFPTDFKEDFAFLDLENTQLQETRGSVLDTISEGRFLLPCRHNRCTCFQSR